MKSFKTFFKQNYLALESIILFDKFVLQKVIVQSNKLQHINDQDTKNIVAQFQSEFGKDGKTYDHLQNDEQVELIKQYQADPNSAEGIAAMQKIVQSKYPWIKYLAVTQALSKNRIKPYQLADAVQNGVLGLHKAINEFDPEQKTIFNAFAKHWIMAYITNPFNPERQKSINADSQGRNGTSVSSLDAPLNAGESDDKVMTLIDRIADQNPYNSPDEILNSKFEKRRFKDLLSNLTDREIKMLTMRYLSDKPKTFKEIGDAIGISAPGARAALEHISEKLIKLSKSN